MVNIGSVNFGTNAYWLSQSIPNGQAVFSLGDFSIYACDYRGEQNFFVDSLDIQNSPTTKNVVENGDMFEGVDFINENYGQKNISIVLVLQESENKTYSDLITQLKDSFTEIKKTAEYWYRGEMMKIECVLNGEIKFDLKSKFKTATINLIAESFFSSKKGVSLSGSITGSSGLLQMNNAGNRIYPEVELTISGGTCAGIAIGETAGKIRYIRNSMNGSTANGGSHFVEIKAFEKVTGTNITLGKPVSGYLQEASGKPYSRFTDNDILSGNYTAGNIDGYNYLQVDLGGIYDIEKIQMWHYYADSRIYHDNKLEVSLDGIQWITLYDSNIDGEYKETSQGKTIYLEEKMGVSKGRLVVDQELNSGDIIYVNFESGDIRVNGLEAETYGTTPKLITNSNITITGFNKYNYPNLDQVYDPMSGSSGNSSTYITPNSDFYRVGHLYSGNNIDWLKKLVMQCRNDFSYAVELTFRFYTDISKNTQIHEIKKIVYGGQYIYELEVDFDENGGLGLDMSGYSSFYLECYINDISALPNNDEEYFVLDRSSSGGTGTSYDSDMNALSYVWDWKLYGLAGNYEPTPENISGVDYSVSYKNKYL